MKIYSGFENDIHELLKGNFKAIANRCNDSSRYVSMISEGKRKIRSQTSILIFANLRELLKVLSLKKYDAYLDKVDDSQINIIRMKTPSIYEDYLLIKKNNP